MSSARVAAVNTVKTENVVGSSRMDEEDTDVLKQNGGGQGGGKTTPSPTFPEVRSEESRPEVGKTATTTSGDNDVKEGVNGRSQYHSIQRLLSPGTGSQLQPVASNGTVSGSQQSTAVGVAGAAGGAGGAGRVGGPGGGRYPMTSSSSAAASLMSGLIAGLFVDKDQTMETSAPVRHGTQLDFRKDAIHEDPQKKAEVMASTKVEGQRSTADGVTRKGWAVEDGSDGARNGSGGGGGGLGGGREVEVSVNDFLTMDSTEDNEFAMKSPLTDLSNTSSSSEEEDEDNQEEEEDLSDGREEEEEILLNGNRHQRFQEEAEEEEEEEEDMEMDVQGKTCGRGGEDAEVNSNYLEDEGASGFSDSGSYGDSVEAKRARMESIVTNMKRSPSSTSNEIAHAERGLRIVEPRRPKRKQYIPKQHDSSAACRRSADVVVEAEPEMAAAAKKIRTSEKEELQQELCRMQDRLADMREKYFQIFGGDPTTLEDKRYEEGDDDEDDEEAEQGTSETERKKREAMVNNNNRLFANGSGRYLEEQTSSPLCADAPNELKHLAGLLKAEISNTVGTLVDEIVKNFLKRNHRGGPTKGPITSSKWSGGGPDSTANSTEKVSPIDDKIREDQMISGDQKEEEVSTPQLDTKPLLLLPPYFSQNPVRSPPPPSSASLLLPQPVRPQPASILTDFAKVSAVGGFSHLLPFSTAAPSKPLKTSSSKLSEKFLHSPFFDPQHHHHHIQRSPMPAIFPHPFFHHTPVMAAAAAAAVAAGMFAKEPEQTEALPLIVNTPTKKKRTKVTDTRLSPRAARAILQENGQTHPRHQHQQQQPYPAHMAEDGTAGSKQQNHLPSSSTDHHRPNSNETEQDSFFTSFHPQHHQQHHHNHHQSHPHQHHQQHHVSHHHHPLLPVTLPTSVAIPNPSLRHSDIMQAFYGHRKHHQHQHHQQQCLELDLPATSSSSPRSASQQQQQQQQRFTGSGLDRPPRASLPGHVMRSASSSPEVGQTSSDGFSGSMMTKADSMDNYDGSIYDDQAMTSTLTPMHLRKAKLMFFYVRYPSSAILKVYFPDVKFNKNNTAQLIKWFSNFREFYYIQMEKYARQALAEGVKNPGDIVVSSDSELYRVLVLHYNRNNRIEVPDNFRQTVQATLREFFKSIQGEKDQEPSWKKSIYKVIAHLDDTVPEYFKSPNWMEQLADG